MEQSGEAPEPEQPAAQPELPVPPADATDGDGTGPPSDRAFVIVGILLLVFVVGVLAWLAHGDDGLDAVAREEQRFPSPSTVEPPATAAASTVVGAPPSSPASMPSATPAPTAPATPPPTPAVNGATTTSAPGPTATSISASPASAPGSTPAEPEQEPYVAQLVPDVAAFSEHLATPEAVHAAVEEMLASGRHDVAAPGRAATVCAAVPMSQPLALRGRWERDGRRIALTDLERRDAPGFGECLDNDGDILAAGAYQYIAIDNDGRESAAGGIVLGAALVEQQFANDGDEPICAVRIAPATTRYFEVYVYDAAPVTPGSAITLAVAAVEQDVETVGCAGGEVLGAFRFHPDSAAVQSLVP